MSNIQRPSLDELEAYLRQLEAKEAAEAALKPPEAPPIPQQPVSPPVQQPTVEPVQEQPKVEEASEPANINNVKAKSTKPKPKRSLLSRIWGVVSTILVIAVILLAIALVGVRVIGYTPYAVLSPSMTPTYAPGDLIYVKETPTDEIDVGDAITFVADSNNTVVTHRVVEVDRDGRKFYTQGDANANRDGNPVLYENVLGVVEFSIPKLGYVSSYVTSETGRYVAIAGVFALILLWILPELFRPEEEKVEEQTKAKD